MKVAILAGGRGTRLGDEALKRPKPMVEIGGRPLLWHIMNTYARYGHSDFLIACGYLGEIIKEYVRNFSIYNGDFVVETGTGSCEMLGARPADWRITVVDTGLETMTGGRLRRLREFVGKETFMFTYGDGLADVNIEELLAFHRKHGKLATITGVHPPSRFGELIVEGDTVAKYSEKPQAGEGWINGGFFVLEPAVLDYIPDDQTAFEYKPLERLTAERQLMVYRHAGFWQPMDTIREKNYLEGLWAAGRAPWKIW